MRILTHGQAFWAKSAYGTQLRMLQTVLAKGGHEVGQAITFGFTGRKIQLGDLMLYPHLNESAGQDVISAHVQDFKADIVLSLGDVFMFNPDIWRHLPWVAWATIDSRPLWQGIANALPAAKVIIAYSLFGQNVLRQCGFENALYMPLAYDPAAYYPVDRMKARSAMGLPGDRFIVGMVQANRQKDNRKNFFGQIAAFRKFQLKHPNAFLYLHTCMSPYRGGFDLFGLMNELEMKPKIHYGFVNEYIETTIGATDDQMRDTYNSFDVLLQATKAEGFGVPALEASACRVPVVYTDSSALPEAVHYGYRVECDPEWQPAGSWYALPRHDSIVDALERAYQVAAYDLNKGEPVHYRLDMVVDIWLATMEQIRQAMPQPAQEKLAA